jgi:S-adenosylmethionine:tRNA ribosyltransferase-isomerase
MFMENLDRLLSSYNYDLPPELIAQTPAVPRDSSRLLVVEDQQKSSHRIFRDLAELLTPGDLLVFNNTRVIPARLYGHKSTGAPVEILLLSEHSHNRWLALVKPGRKLKIGTRIKFHPQVPDPNLPELTATIVDRDEPTGGRYLQFHLPDLLSLMKIIDRFGQLPLPPYITSKNSTPDQYQTIYASVLGAVAAPTAGLHFTPELLARLDARGIERAEVTLHVGIGTFRPIEVENILEHQMHQEWLAVSQATVTAIDRTKARGNKVFAVGTTAVRALESAAFKGTLQPMEGNTGIFIYPGYQWRVIDGLITNFHLPGSSLMMLVSAAMGRERLLQLYEVAKAECYRFYSFGDAMLLLPKSFRPSSDIMFQATGLE